MPNSISGEVKVVRDELRAIVAKKVEVHESGALLVWLSDPDPRVSFPQPDMILPGDQWTVAYNKKIGRPKWERPSRV